MVEKQGMNIWALLSLMSSHMLLCLVHLNNGRYVTDFEIEKRMKPANHGMHVRGQVVFCGRLDQR